MKKISILFKTMFVFFLFFVGVTFSDRVIVLEFQIDKNDNTELSNIYLVEGIETAILNNTQYTVELTDENRVPLRKVYFKPVFHAYGADISFDKITIDSRLNYFENATHLFVKKNEKTLLEVDLKGRFCNNDTICEKNENALSCPNDCGPEDADYYCTKISGDGICDPDCSQNSDAECPPIGRALEDTDDNSSNTKTTAGSKEGCLPMFGLGALLLIVSIRKQEK